METGCVWTYTPAGSGEGYHNHRTSHRKQDSVASVPGDEKYHTSQRGPPTRLIVTVKGEGAPVYEGVSPENP